MGGLLEFAARFGTEERCIEHLAGLRWPGGFVCAGCGEREAWRLKARPRVYECGKCHRQESVTAGTVFHRTRTDLAKWFLAAYLMGRDKRGVSAKFLQRELGVAYQTAWTIAHKLRHGLNEDRPVGCAASSRRTRPSSAAGAIRQVADEARPIPTRAWSSPPSRRCRRRRTRMENTGTPSSVSTASLPATRGSPCCRPRRAPNSAPSSRRMSRPSRTS